MAKYKFHFLILISIVALYFLIRLPNLTLQPIFADEAIYIRWAQIMKSEPTLRFVSLQDGKTPLFMWAMTPLFKVFTDPLFAGRFLSVISGFFTLLGVLALGRKVFNPKAAILGALIYAVVPYTVFFDRMALVDSMLATFTIWAIYFALWIIQSPRLDLAMILGYLMGGALLVKTPALTNIVALPLTIIAFVYRGKKSKILKLLLFWGVAVTIAITIYSILRLGPGFSQLSARNADYMFTLDELKGRPLDPFIPHLHDVRDWFIHLITIPVTILIFLGLIFAVLSKNRLSWAILAWIAVPLILEMTFLKTFTARYILMAIPPLLVFAGFGLSKIVEKIKFDKRLVLVGSLLVTLSFPVYVDYLLVTDIASVSLPRNERKGYLEDWTAGYGLKEIAKYLEEQNQRSGIVVGTDGYFGTLPEGLYIYLDKAGIPIIGSNATVSATLRNTAKQKPTYFVLNSTRHAIIEGVEKILEFPKIKPLEENKPQNAIILVKVLP